MFFFLILGPKGEQVNATVNFHTIPTIIQGAVGSPGADAIYCPCPIMSRKVPKPTTYKPVDQYPAELIVTVPPNRSRKPRDSIN